jgi:hypothetical protein
MPCNLAVTITKAVTAPEHLQALLTPEIVKTLVESFVRSHEIFQAYSNAQVRITTGTKAIDILLDWRHRITIYPNRQGVWQVQTLFQRGEEKLSQTVTELFTTLLAKGADRLYAKKVKGVLSSFGKVAESQAKVKDGEQTVDVTLLKFEINV